MNIKPAVYESLTTYERIIATLEAQARKDDAETERLVKTCPKKSYSISDPAYSDKMHALSVVASIIELDMRSHAMNYFMIEYLRSKPSAKQEVEHKDTIKELTALISIQSAWHEALEKEGIELDLMERAFNGLIHFGVEWLLVAAKTMELDIDSDIKEDYKNRIVEFLN